MITKTTFKDWIVYNAYCYYATKNYGSSVFEQRDGNDTCKRPRKNNNRKSVTVNQDVVEYLTDYYYLITAYVPRTKKRFTRHLTTIRRFATWRARDSTIPLVRRSAIVFGRLRRGTRRKPSDTNPTDSTSGGIETVGFRLRVERERTVWRPRLRGTPLTTAARWEHRLVVVLVRFSIRLSWCTTIVFSKRMKSKRLRSRQSVFDGKRTCFFSNRRLRGTSGPDRISERSDRFERSHTRAVIVIADLTVRRAA